MEKNWTAASLFMPRGRWGHRPSLAEQIRVEDCWIWTGSLTYHGYGQSALHGLHSTTHRLVWMCLVGPIPHGKVLDHLCRNRSCCNPDHLRMVSQSQNMMASPLRGGGVLLRSAA